MLHPSRRDFLYASAGAIHGSLLATARSRAASATERFRLGVIGCGNQGSTHFRALSQLPNLEIVYVCDVDEERLGKGIEHQEKKLNGGPVEKLAHRGSPW